MGALVIALIILYQVKICSMLSLVVDLNQNIGRACDCYSALDSMHQKYAPLFS